MLRRTSVVITTTGASPLIELSPVSSPTRSRPCRSTRSLYLVGQRLDGRRVEALAALREGKMDGELTDHGLAGPGRGADEHAAAILERLAGFTLEGVEVERQLFRES